MDGYCLTTGCGRKLAAAARHARYCRACQKQLLAAGLCKRCGLLPRTFGQAGRKSEWCDKCEGEQVARAREMAANPPPPPEILPPLTTPKYRGPMARENTYETKHG